MTRAKRFGRVRKERRGDYERLAERLGTTDEETVWDFVLGALPYSTIPEASDAHEVLDWLERHGWTRE